MKNVKKIIFIGLCIANGSSCMAAVWHDAYRSDLELPYGNIANACSAFCQQYGGWDVTATNYAQYNITPPRYGDRPDYANVLGYGYRKDSRGHTYIACACKY